MSTTTFLSSTSQFGIIAWGILFLFLIFIVIPVGGLLLIKLIIAVFYEGALGRQYMLELKEMCEGVAKFFVGGKLDRAAPPVEPKTPPVYTVTEAQASEALKNARANGGQISCSRDHIDPNSPTPPQPDEP